MPEHPQIALLSVPFRDTTLFVVEWAGRPYAPLQPILDGMGLGWHLQQPQHATLPKRYSAADILICLPGEDQPNHVCCIPLHKLFGLLGSIKTKKVKASLREKIMLYQSECDEALWDSWYRSGGARTEHTRASLDILDDCTLATECFQELGALFISIARFATKSDTTLSSLARIGHERAEWWCEYFGRQTQRADDQTQQ